MTSTTSTALSPPAPRWYALAVHTRSERVAADDLAAVDGCEVFLPVRVERRAWTDRIKRVEAPLFPGYLFVRAALTAERRVALLRASARAVDVVGRITGDERIARAIPDVEIDALRVVVEAERALDPIERLVRGKHVFIATGPLRGARGVVEEGPDGRRRLVVQIALLGRGVRTVLLADDVVETVPDVA